MPNPIGPSSGGRGLSSARSILNQNTVRLEEDDAQSHWAVLGRPRTIVR